MLTKPISHWVKRILFLRDLVKSQRQYTELHRVHFFSDFGNSCFHILFSLFAGMAGNLMLIALILSNQLRPRLNMHVLCFCGKCCRVLEKENYMLEHGALHSAEGC